MANHAARRKGSAWRVSTGAGCREIFWPSSGSRTSSAVDCNHGEGMRTVPGFAQVQQGVVVPNS